MEAPPRLSTRDRSSFLLCLRMFSELFPLGENRDGLLWWTVRTHGNSGGVAITQPRVEGRSTSTLGKNTTLLSYSVRVAISRRRYAQSAFIAHPPQESIVNEEGINYNYVNQHVPQCLDQPYWFVSFDTKARDL